MISNHGAFDCSEPLHRYMFQKTLFFNQFHPTSLSIIVTFTLLGLISNDVQPICSCSDWLLKPQSYRLPNHHHLGGWNPPLPYHRLGVMTNKVMSACQPRRNWNAWIKVITSCCHNQVMTYRATVICSEKWLATSLGTWIHYDDFSGYN